MMKITITLTTPIQKNCTDMSDLKVTDVQKIIREYAASGHDITQSPRHVHVDGKPYGMVIGHELGISHNQNWAHLGSYIMQAERPLVTKILSVSIKSYLGGSGSHKYGSGSHKYLTNPSNRFGANGWHSESQNRGGLWTPHDTLSSYKDMNEAIQSHTSSKISHMGRFTNEKGIESEMTPEHHSSFDEHEALLHLTGVKPFSGLVHVKDNSHTKSYTYNPNTEELHKHDS